eukprot:440319-Amphidinium_carterae.1
MTRAPATSHYFRCHMPPWEQASGNITGSGARLQLQACHVIKEARTIVVFKNGRFSLFSSSVRTCAVGLLHLSIQFGRQLSC